MLSLEDDDRLLLKEDSTLKAAGIGEKVCVCMWSWRGRWLSRPGWQCLADYIWTTQCKVNATLGALYTT